MREELNIPPEFDNDKARKYGGILEKKWTSVVRLQKKASRRLGSLNVNPRLCHG